MTTPSPIELRIEEGVATLLLNRPDKRNAFTDVMRTDYIDALERVTNDTSIRALIVTGAGKGFCAGGDVAGMQARMDAPAGEVAMNGWRRQQRVHHAVTLLHSMPKPTIAAVNGAAAGLGADLAMSCDFVITSNAASFAWSYIKRGLIPDGGGLHFLPRRVSLSRTKELIFSGRRVDAAEALELGITDRLSTPEDLLADAHAWAAELAQGSSAALALGKALLNRTYEMSADEMLAQGSQAQAVCYSTSEHRDAVRAFLGAQAARREKAV
jgi:enoyl-CoA hydratase/carnithine racemase